MTRRDVYLGTGGAPEAVLAAAAIKCVGGRDALPIWPRTDEERDKLLSRWRGPHAHLYRQRSRHGENVSFAATGITTGELLRGVGTAPRARAPTR